MNNDLISRDALKKAIKELSNDNPSYWNSCDVVDREKVLDEIDNAPTVLYDNYSMGYQDGVKKVLSERPQGEWEESHILSCGNILRMGENVIEHKCKNCGRWSIKWVRTKPDNFCSNCGADMKGGAE